MLHRVKKINDENHDKWIGVGGHFEPGESPFECIIREVREETGLDVSGSISYRGIITFSSESYEDEQMHLFTADGSSFGDEKKPADCDEGVLEWISKEKLMSLPMWEGDRIFLGLLDTESRFFSLKLEYDSDGRLVRHELRFSGKEPLFVSACLLGVPCRYDGRSKPLDKTIISELDRRYQLIPVCPEQMGGLETPRLPCELRNGRVIRKDGADLTESYQRGAEEVLRLARLSGVRKALLKAKSPSCGVGRIYDGSFSGKLIPGDGLTAKMLISHGIEVFSEDTLGESS